jgi:hypothetical protein
LAGARASSCDYAELDEQQQYWVYKRYEIVQPLTIFRPTALAMIVMVGQTMGIASAKAYSDVFYNRGNGFALGSLIVRTISTGVLIIYI